MKKDMISMAKNKNFLLLLTIFASLYGCYTCLGAVINDLCEPYGFGSSDAGMFVGVFIVSGLTGSFVLSGFLDKYNAYLKILRIVCFGSLVFSSAMVFSLNYGVIWVVCINIALLGFFLLPIIPVCYSFAVELTYPVSEAMSNGLLMLFSQLVGIVDTTAGTELTINHAQWCIYMFIGQIAFACLITLVVKEDLRRINAEKVKSKKKEIKEEGVKDFKLNITENTVSDIS